MVDRIFKFFSSLRLTVTLLSLSLLLVFFGTLAQVHEGLYDAQTRYFKSWVIWKPTIGNHQWPLLFPGGYLIGTLLLINLLAAHIKRFQFTRKKLGIQLIHGGLVLLLLGQLLTDALSRESSMRLFEGSSSNYSEDYRANEFVVTDTSDPATNLVVSIPERYLEQKGEIRDASLPATVRVLDYWQNCDVNEIPPANAIAVKADRGLYTNTSVLPLAAPANDSDRAHPAVYVELLAGKDEVGSFLVTTPKQGEAPQTFNFNGKDYEITMLFAPMMGGNLLSIARAGDTGGESMVTFPEADLSAKGELHNEKLPFNLHVKDFWSNCRFYPRPDAKSVHPKLTKGLLANCFVNPEPPITDSDHRNFPGAVVELSNGKGSLGTWLLWAGEAQAGDSVKIDGRRYELALQFKRYYTPYSIGLLKFSHDNYKGTDTAKNFASRIRLVNPKSHEDREVLIRMNNPLRYKGTTYYQASFDRFRPDVTILEVVTNPSWLTPYLACGLVALGMIIQFMSHLIGFATKRRTV